MKRHEKKVKTIWKNDMKRYGLTASQSVKLSTFQNERRNAHTATRNKRRAMRMPQYVTSDAQRTTSDVTSDSTRINADNSTRAARNRQG